MRRALERLAREPLLHFLVLGALLAGLEGLAAPAEPPAEARVLVVDPRMRQHLEEELRRELGREPEAEELDRRVQAWIDDELFYREGLLRGLDRRDPGVRERVAALTASALEARSPIEEPSEEALRAYFEAHLARYAEQARFDFVQVYVEGLDDASRLRAEELLTTLRAGGSPIGLGDVYPGGRHYRGRVLGALADTFGPSFVEGFAETPDGEWSLRRSNTGFHLVRIERRTAASPAEFERAELDVAHDFMEDARSERLSRVRRELRSRWRVIE